MMNKPASIWTQKSFRNEDKLASFLIMTKLLFLKDWALSHL